MIQNSRTCAIVTLKRHILSHYANLVSHLFIQSGLSVISMALGYYHTCAIVASGPGGGGIKCWGNNGNGQLGTGGTSTQYYPQDVGLGKARGVRLHLSVEGGGQGVST